MTAQHEEEGYVNSAANPAAPTSGAGAGLKTTPYASVRASSIHENDAANGSYRVYGSYDLGWEDIRMRKGLDRTILSMRISEAKDSLALPEEQKNPPIKTFTECLRGILWEGSRWQDHSFVRVLSLPSDEGVFMADSPDSHFIVQVPHQTEQKFEQRYSFRFPSLSRIGMACTLSWFGEIYESLYDSGNKGHSRNYVRGTITGAGHDEYKEIFSSQCHPLVFIIRGFWHIDKMYNRVDLLECIQTLQDIENKLQRPEPHSLGGLSIHLNALNTKISGLRTCVQYIKASMDNISAITDLYRHNVNTKVRQYILRKWQDLESDVISLQKVSEQRLLDVESVQQRINISLSVVSNLLAQKENEWNHNMARSQKTIAMLTMFFLPATFFAILFTLPLFNWDPSKGPVLTDKLWIYWTFTVPLTVLLFLCYFLFGHVKHLLLYLRRKVSIDHRFPFCHLRKTGLEEDLETGLRVIDSNVDENENGDGKGKAKTG